MNKAAILFLIFFLTLGAFAQKPVRSTKRSTSAKPAQTPKPKLSEKEQFDAASALETSELRIPALQKFLEDFPASEHRTAALELIAVSRALSAEEKLISGDGNGAFGLYKLIIEESPKPFSRELFAETLSKIPTNLFRYGYRSNAAAAAELLESNTAAAPQLLDIAAFYLSIEDGSSAARLAEKAIAADPNFAPAYQVLGISHRLNFRLEDAAAAYAKAIEVSPSPVAKRDLADLNRALGKHDEAVAIYRELLAADPSNIPAQTGLALALFDSGNQAEAEAEMARSLDATPNNIILLAGAAYWYASHGDGGKAVELAQKAIANEPRYIWSHIALARGLMAQKKPLEAERVLFNARKYGNFPTLEYELASARLAAGFYREAAEELRKSFAVTDGNITTRLGGRVTASDKDFISLLAAERRASIFQPAAADDPVSAERLRRLLELDQSLESGDASVAASAAVAFAGGSDNMKLHRELYAASRLLEKQVALETVSELTAAALGGADASLDVDSPNSAVMASELYESRKLAAAKGEMILVPEVPRQTLSAIVRGRIEELAGAALFYQNNAPAAVVRLKRAVSVLPVNSAWWRSGMWRLGTALEAAGSEKEALDAYIKSYRADRPDPLRYITVESLYKRINGSTDGLAMLLEPPAAAPQAAPAAARAQTVRVADSRPEPAESPQPRSTPAVFPRGVPVEREAAALPAPRPVAVEPAEPKQEIVPETKTETPVEAKAEIATETTTETPVETKTEAVPDVPAENKTDAAEENKVETPSETKSDTVPETKTEAIPIEPKAETPAAVVPEIELEAAPEKAQTAIIEPTPEPKPEPAQPAVTEQAVEKAAESSTIPEPTAVPETKEAPQPLPDRRAEPEPELEPERPATTFERPRRAPQLVITDGLAPKPRPAPERTAEQKKTPADTSRSIFDPVIITIPRREPDTAHIKSCNITVSQDRISLINNGGRVGLIVGIDESEGDVREVIARSSSDDDVKVTPEPEIAGVAGRAFYVITSMSDKVGVYNVVFEAPCGRKEVVVRVR